MNVIGTLKSHLGDEQPLVICGRRDDGDEWERALPGCVAVVRQPAAIPRQQPLDTYVPERTATLLTIDSIAPTTAGGRPIIGGRQAVWRLFEDKTVIDCLWDTLGIPRPASIIGDHTLDIASAGRIVDRGDGVVCAVQEPGSHSGNAQGIWWWTDRPPQVDLTPDSRIKLTPLLAGRALRLHGLVTADAVIPLPPMDVVTLPRLDRHQFLCCGCVPCPTEDWALDLTRQLGHGIRDTIGYRGMFSVDGIVVDGCFMPTDLNTRVTSAIESAPALIRVRFQAANICAREGLPVDPDEITQLGVEAFGSAETTIYGAASMVRSQRRSTPIFQGPAGLTDTPDTSTTRAGSMAVARSSRGWTVSSRLASGHDPRVLASDIWRLSDRVFGTDFGDLGCPFDGSAASDRCA